MSRARAIVLTIAVVSATVTACGDDGNDRVARRVPVEPRTVVTTVRDGTLGAPPTTDSRTVASTSPTDVETIATIEPTGAVVPVGALDNSFRPEVVEISVGDEVLWENRGLNDHDVLTVEGDDWGVEVEGFGPGATYAHVFATPGEYRYFCSIHGNETIGMVGTIIVAL